MEKYNIPTELVDSVRKMFEADPSIRDLRLKQKTLQSSGQYMEALKVAKEIELCFTITLRENIRKSQAEIAVFDSRTSNMPRGDKDEISILMTSVYMASDIIESAVVDMNNVIHRTFPDYTITAFDDLRHVLILARQKLKFLRNSGDLMKDLAWGEYCDNMYDMMKSKAKSILRKRKESKDWGKNAEEL